MDDSFMLDVTYWSAQLNKNHKELESYKKKLYEHPTYRFNTREILGLRELLGQNYGLCANLASAVSREQALRKLKKPLWKKLFRK